MMENAYQCRYSTQEDYELLLDTADRIFTLRTDENGLESYQKGYFKGLQSKLYATPAFLPPHLLVYDGDKLAGLAGIRPCELRMGDETLRLCGLGTLGVCREYRGQGIMQLMMNRLNQDMREMGIDIAELGGRRKRYARFGYFTGSAGVDLSFAWEDVAEAEEKNISFTELTQNDPAELPLFCRLFSRRAVHVVRKEETFLPTLRTGNRRALLIRLKDEPIGYASVSGNFETVVELELTDPALLPSMLRAYCVQYALRRVSLHNLSPLDSQAYAPMLREASSLSVSWGERYRIFNYRRVLEAGLRTKAKQGGLASGALTLAIQDCGTYTVCVNGGSVEVTENVASAPMLTLSEEEATVLLLGAGHPLGVLPKDLPAFAADWFPLPFHIDSNDRI